MSKITLRRSRYHLLSLVVWKSFHGISLSSVYRCLCNGKSVAQSYSIPNGLEDKTLSVAQSYSIPNGLEDKTLSSKVINAKL